MSNSLWFHWLQFARDAFRDFTKYIKRVKIVEIAGIVKLAQTTKKKLSLSCQNTQTVVKKQSAIENQHIISVNNLLYLFVAKFN